MGVVATIFRNPHVLSIKLDIKIIGTVGILLLAKQKSIVTKIEPIILALKNKGYFLSDALIIEVLK